MKQPGLGKKIAELRKAKGLTQDELVQKCNLNVRTLQRIESGEVTPRDYTIKLIFTALDYKADSSKSIFNKISIARFINFQKLEQFYKYVFDLFNLKTNTMKKLVILSVSLLIISTVLVSCLKNQHKEIGKNSLIGTWQICNATTGLADTCYAKTGQIRYKMITSNKFVVTDIEFHKRALYGAFNGTYTVNNDIYTETIENTGSGYGQYLGNTNSFKFKIDGDFLYIKGINNNYNEIWKRVKE